jgi:acetyltransferase-like isoleucine patch superfamily enzyme
MASVTKRLSVLHEMLVVTVFCQATAWGATLTYVNHACTIQAYQHLSLLKRTHEQNCVQSEFVLRCGLNSNASVYSDCSIGGKFVLLPCKSVIIQQPLYFNKKWMHDCQNYLGRDNFFCKYSLHTCMPLK